MNSSGILMGILPLLAFVIIDSFLGVKWALISASLLSIIEGIWTYMTFGELDWITGTSIFLVILMAFFAYWKKEEKYFLFQPVVLSVILGLFMLISYFLGHPILYEMMIKYKDFLPPQNQQLMAEPIFKAILIKSSLTTGFGLILHGAVTAYCALKLSKWWWIAMRGIGIFIFMGLSFVAARFLI